MSQCQIGVFGLGVMGSSLAENFLRHGFTVALYSREQSERERFAKRDVSGYEIYTWISEERTENDGYRDICTLSVNPYWFCFVFFFSSCLPVFIGNADDTHIKRYFPP